MSSLSVDGSDSGRRDNEEEESESRPQRSRPWSLQKSMSSHLTIMEAQREQWDQHYLLSQLSENWKYVLNQWCYSIQISMIWKYIVLSLIISKDANQLYWIQMSSKIGTLRGYISSVAQSWSTLCEPMDCSKAHFSVHHQLSELAQTHVHRVSDFIQPSHPLSSPSPPAFNLSQHQGPFQWISSSHQVAKVLELQV